MRRGFWERVKLCESVTMSENVAGPILIGFRVVGSASDASNEKTPEKYRFGQLDEGNLL